MRLPRRGFMGSAASTVLLAATAATVETPPLLPWEREISLREAARSMFVERTLDPQNPLPDLPGASWPPGPAMAILNPAIKSSLWVLSHRITLSILKTDVHDRRVKWPHVVTLREIREGAYSSVNKSEIPVLHDTARGVPGYLAPEGGRRIPYVECWHAYPFPCQKLVGQIILMLDEPAGAAAPTLKQSCSNGLVRFQVQKGTACAELEIVLSMTRNVYSIRTTFTALTAPLRLRLYRHQDQGHLRYMTPEGMFHALKTFDWRGGERRWA